MATLLPRGKQQFIDATGAPLVGGKVYHYIPGTTTAKDTYQDASATVLNTNPIILDGRGEAVIYGTGSYRQLVQDSLSNLIWDQLTADTSSTNNIWGGTSTGSANAQVVLAGNLSGASGQGVQFIAGFSNSGAMTINGIPVVKDTTAGVINLTGGEVIAGSIESVIYDASIGKFHLSSYSDPISGSITPNKLALGSWTSVASAGTTDLGAQASLNIVITGTTTITSFGTTATTHGAVYHVRFAAALTLTNGANLILPGAANLTTIAGDVAQIVWEGSNVWRCIAYERANGSGTRSSTISTSAPSGGSDGDIWYQV